ncbi:MAG: DJ-1/PfpI family protein [Paramuribaculum sp.]|nr:DJ-1/PfpI family protein [Paramuribaculum sp.]MDE6323807.1 DJ-1/PfpI family protein [Paramuribaculum sp.]MDE6489308.1 DJ-1/PfpI family protein [Paramuribaculum sp.]
MKHSFLFLADGFEEIEAVATVDVLRRCGMTVNTVAINPDGQATGANGVVVTADRTINEVELDPETEWLICPGGMPGASNLASCGKLNEMLTTHYENGGRIAAICASPAVVLAPLGILHGRKATCYPGFESMVESGVMTGDPVVALDTLVTGNGPGNTIAFALAIAAISLGTQAAGDVASGMMVRK